MSDLRKLAERIARETAERAEPQAALRIERILREHHEGLAEAVRDLVHGLVDQQAMADDWWEPELDRILRVLGKGGEQAAAEPTETGASTVAGVPTATPPAAADPHDVVYRQQMEKWGDVPQVMNYDAQCDKCNGTGRMPTKFFYTIPCDCGVRDSRTGGEQAQPSHVAGEVVDSSHPDTEHPTSALPVAPATHAFVVPEGGGPGSPCAHTFTYRADGSRAICYRPIDDPIHDVPQVTNYDAEAEARARDNEVNDGEEAFLAGTGCEADRIPAGELRAPVGQPQHQVDEDRDGERGDVRSAVGDGRENERRRRDGEHEDAVVGDAVTEPVYVGPGEEVNTFGPTRWRVVGADPFNPDRWIVVCDEDGFLAMYRPQSLSTTDGRPVAGFKEGRNA